MDTIQATFEELGNPVLPCIHTSQIESLERRLQNSEKKNEMLLKRNQEMILEVQKIQDEKCQMKNARAEAKEELLSVKNEMKHLGEENVVYGKNLVKLKCILDGYVINIIEEKELKLQKVLEK